MTGRCQACGRPLARARGRPRKWCSERCRKAQYAGACERCGGPTDGTTPGQGVGRICRACREWTEPAILEAIRRWAREHDGVPPRLQDWHPAPDGYPGSMTVQRQMGSWSNALAAAGFRLRRDCRPQTQEWIESELRAGRSVRDIAGELGVTRATIYQRLRHRGLTVTAAVRGGYRGSAGAR